MGITALDVTGVEADDVIGTLATRALQQDMAVVIVSPDKVLLAVICCCFVCRVKDFQISLQLWMHALSRVSIGSCAWGC